jgi:ribosomal protein S18 acetylase RimI-like enzyme
LTPEIPSAAPGVAIRPYRVADFPFVAELFGRYLTEEARRGSARALTPEFARRYLPKLVREARSPTAVFLVAECGAERAGFAVGLLKKSPDPWDETRGRAGLLMELHVHPAYRRRGVARTLLGAVERHFREIGCDWLALGVFARNAVAREFYRSRGYRETYLFEGKALRGEGG